MSNDDCEVNDEGCMQSLIIDKSGKKRYDDWDLKSYSEGAIIVKNDSLGFNKHTYWNINGQMFNRYWEIATPFSEGIICVSDYSPSCGIPYDYYDRNGKKLFTDCFGKVSNGVVRIDPSEDDNEYYLDLTGNSLFNKPNGDIEGFLDTSLFKNEVAVIRDDNNNVYLISKYGDRMKLNIDIEKYFDKNNYNEIDIDKFINENSKTVNNFKRKYRLF